MLSAFLAVPVIVFSSVASTSAQGGIQHTAANSFSYEIEEMIYPKSPKMNLANVTERGREDKLSEGPVYPKSIRQNVKTLKRGKKEKSPNTERSYPKDIRQNLVSF
jgi:hypothetical protein